MKEQIDSARLTGLYGLEAECPTLVKFKTTYMDEVFGAPQKCTYDSVIGIVDISNTCNKLAEERWGLAVNKLYTLKELKDKK